MYTSRFFCVTQLAMATFLLFAAPADLPSALSAVFGVFRAWKVDCTDVHVGANNAYDTDDTESVMVHKECAWAHDTGVLLFTFTASKSGDMTFARHAETGSRLHLLHDACAWAILATSSAYEHHIHHMKAVPPAKGPAFDPRPCPMARALVQALPTPEDHPGIVRTLGQLQSPYTKQIAWACYVVTVLPRLCVPSVQVALENIVFQPHPHRALYARTCAAVALCAVARWAVKESRTATTATRDTPLFSLQTVTRAELKMWIMSAVMRQAVRDTRAIERAEEEEPTSPGSCPASKAAQHRALARAFSGTCLQLYRRSMGPCV